MMNGGELWRAGFRRYVQRAGYEVSRWVGRVRGK